MSVRNDPAVGAFITAAQDYCKLIDGRRRGSQQRYLKDLFPKLLKLCESAIHLPDLRAVPKPRLEDSTDWSVRQHEIREHIRKCLGGDIEYRELFDPFENNPVVTASLMDDLADIYLDLKRGLILFESAASEPLLKHAVWEWRFQLFMHWGEHATGALRAIYWTLRRSH